jgi:hypothetical protein
MLKVSGFLRRKGLFRYRISHRRCLLRSCRRRLFRYRFSCRKRQLSALNPQPDRHTYRTDSKKHRTRHDGPTPTHDLPRNVGLWFASALTADVGRPWAFDPRVNLGVPAPLTTENIIRVADPIEDITTERPCYAARRSPAVL